MLPATLKIRYDGKKLRIRADDKIVQDAFSVEGLVESVKGLRRLLIEVYLENPLNYRDYVERIFKELISKIDRGTGITDLYILLEPKDVATNFFMNIGARKVTLAMIPTISNLQSIAKVINNISREVRVNGGIVIKTNSDESLYSLSTIISGIKVPKELLELYFDEIGVKLIKSVLNLFDHALLIRLLGSGDKIIIDLHLKPMEMIDVRGLSKLDDRSLMGLMKAIKRMSGKICNVYIELDDFNPAISESLIKLIEGINSPNCLGISITQSNRVIELKFMHESAIFSLNTPINLLKQVSERNDSLLETITKVLNNNIFMDIVLTSDSVKYRVLPKEKENVSSLTNWLRDINNDVEEFLKIRGIS